MIARRVISGRCVRDWEKGFGRRGLVSGIAQAMCGSVGTDGASARTGVADGGPRTGAAPTDPPPPLDFCRVTNDAACTAAFRPHVDQSLACCAAQPADGGSGEGGRDAGDERVCGKWYDSARLPGGAGGSRWRNRRTNSYLPGTGGNVRRRQSAWHAARHVPKQDIVPTTSLDQSFLWLHTACTRFTDP